jgi:hypothetical protein
MAQKRSRGRPSRLQDPEFLKLTAECFAAGMSRQAMMEELGVKDRDTITRWRRDPRVKELVKKLIEDRVIQISRRVDSVIEGRLTHADKLSTEELIKIRKEYGGAVTARTEKADDALDGAWAALQENPDFVEELEQLMSRAESAQEAKSEDEGPEPHLALVEPPEAAEQE